MLSRIAKQRVGYFFVIISLTWLYGVVGTDDYYTAQHIFMPVLPLMVKILIGLIGLAIGGLIVGGCKNEED